MFLSLFLYVFICLGLYVLHRPTLLWSDYFCCFSVSFRAADVTFTSCELIDIYWKQKSLTTYYKVLLWSKRFNLPSPPWRHLSEFLRANKSVKAVCLSQLYFSQISMIEILSFLCLFTSHWYNKCFSSLLFIHNEQTGWWAVFMCGISFEIELFP